MFTRTPTADPSRPVRVLQPYRSLKPTTNPYIVMLHRCLDATPGVQPVYFSYGRAFRGGYDVVHLHWPETLLGGRTPFRRSLRRLLAFLFLARVRIARVPIVRTLHNLEVPRGLTKADYLFLSLVDRWSVAFIRLNDSTPPPSGKPCTTILLGHYRDWYAASPRSEPRDGRIAFVGLVRRYKNVAGLVRAFTEAVAHDPLLGLVVAGKPSTPELADELTELAQGDPRIHLDLRFIDDDELVSVVTASRLVVLPFSHMHNSSTILTALSLDRPVLVPRNEANQALALEVGPEWVLQFDGELVGATLADSTHRASQPPAAPPDLSRREWSDVGLAHLDVYRRAWASRHARANQPA